jgi:hypothetical protein
LRFSKQEEAFDTQDTNKHVTKRMDCNPNNDIRYRRKCGWTTTKSDQQHRRMSEAGQSLCDRLNGSVRSLNYPGNFARVCGPQAREISVVMHQWQKARNSLRSGSEEKLKIEVF